MRASKVDAGKSNFQVARSLATYKDRRRLDRILDAIVYLVHFGPKLEVSSLRQTSVEAD